MSSATDLSAVRVEAEEWLEHFRNHANPQTAEERWEYLDQAAVLIEKLLEAESADRGTNSFFKDAIPELLSLLEGAWKREDALEQEVARLQDELLKAPRQRVCPVCDGLGSIPGFWLGTVKSCTTCHGSGRQ